jgi:hypothetical protein
MKPDYLRKRVQTESLRAEVSRLRLAWTNRGRRGLHLQVLANNFNLQKPRLKVNFTIPSPHSVLTAYEPLAPSPRIIALLARRLATINPKMALVEVPQETSYPPLEEKKPFTEPASVLVTPCDPWPRPYYLENGLRRVAPYHYTYNTYCKERWRGRELLDIFSSEFRDRPLEYYVSAGPRRLNLV